MKIIITEEQKKKLFIPRKLSGEGSRWSDWNKEQPIKDGKRINQYDIETGKKEGIWEDYYDDGQIYSKGSYVNDIKDGYWEYYWSNGSLCHKGNYKNDVKEGYWENYWINGNLLRKELFDNGELIKSLPITESKKLFIPRRIDERLKDWNEMQPIKNGKRINQYDMDGRRDGYWEDYWANGRLKSKIEFKNGKRNGIIEYYWTNGNLEYKGSYINGKRDGIWKEYFSNGNGELLFKTLYKDGKLIKSLPLTESKHNN